MKPLLERTLITTASVLLALSVPVAGPEAWAQAAPAAAQAQTPSSTTGTGSASDTIDMQALREAVKTDKKAYVASMLDLTPAQAKKFWPIYDKYQAAVNLANQERAVTLNGLLSRSGPMTNAYAKQVAAAEVTADETELRARRTLYRHLMRAVPAEKAARYLQLESKIRAAQAYDIASTIPLVH